MSNNAVAADGGLNWRAFEPAIEKITGRSHEEITRIPLQVEVEGSNSVGYPAGLGNSAIAANWLSKSVSAKL